DINNRTSISTTVDKTPTDAGNSIDDMFNGPFLFGNDDMNTRIPTSATVDKTHPSTINTDAGNSIYDSLNEIIPWDQLPLNDDINRIYGTLFDESFISDYHLFQDMI
ncbi:5945_t:CDS:1, partial [Ambispora leptoticha]